MSGPLSGTARATFLDLADALIPAAEGMPAASEVGIADDLLAEVLNYRPDLFGPLQEILRTAEGRDPSAEVRRMASDEPEGFHALGLIVAGGYYLSETVRTLIGYPGQQRLPIVAGEIPEYASNGMLAKVAGRAPMWRSGDTIADTGDSGR